MSGSPCLVFQTTSSFKQLAAAHAQQFDDARAMVEVVPELLGIEELQLVLLVAEQVAQPPVVEQDPPLLVDDADRGRTDSPGFREAGAPVRATWVSCWVSAVTS